MECSLIAGEDALGRRLKEVERSVFVHDAVSDKFIDCFDLFLRSKCALKDIAVRHFDTNLGSSVVSFLHLSVESDA